MREARLPALRDEPGLFRAMVANGFERAVDYSFAAITGAWSTLLDETLPERFREDGLDADPARPPARRRLRHAFHRALSRVGAA